MIRGFDHYDVSLVYRLVNIINCCAARELQNSLNKLFHCEQRIEHILSIADWAKKIKHKIQCQGQEQEAIFPISRDKS
jgi:hypothetical protein